MNPALLWSPVSAIGLASCLWIFPQWRRGIYLFNIAVPFAGAISLLLYPAVWPRVGKEIFIILPTYVAFICVWRKSKAVPTLPRSILWPTLLLVCIVLLECLNPRRPDWGVLLIGVKTWLFALPLILLGNLLLEERSDLPRFLRPMVLLAWIPLGVAWIQYVGSQVYGYEKTMQKFYGEAAAGATQLFARFPLGGGTIYRIPSTFTFPSQYYNYLLCLLMATYSLGQLDDSRGWRRFSMITFYAVIFSSYLAGVRAAYVLTPFYVGVLYGLDRGFLQAVKITVISLALMFVALKLPGIQMELHRHVQSGPNISQPKAHSLPPPQAQTPAPASPKLISIPLSASLKQAIATPAVLSKATVGRGRDFGIDLGQWEIMMQYCVTHYPKEIAYEGIKQGILEAPLGFGPGVNTGASRYARSNDQWHAFENYYAKTVYELGIPGLLAIGWLFGSVLSGGFRLRKSLNDVKIRSFGVAILTLILLYVIYNFKGWLIDLDPINTYFWLFIGILFALPKLSQMRPIRP